MTKLFEPFKLGDITLKNRVVMAPLTRNRSPNAIPGPFAVEYYRQRAGAGLLITEGTAITHQGQGYADVPGLYKSEAIDAWKKVTDAVHKAGGHIFTQIWHVGRVSHTSLQPNGDAPVAPSAVTAKSKTYIINADGSGAFAETSEPRALTLEEIKTTVQDYAHAAKAAIEAGFDGVEIHGANGYLIGQFLKSGANKRIDEYGGPIENRARFLVEVVEAVVAAVGGERTGLRLSPVTPANDISDDDPQALYDYVAKAIAAYPLAYVHIIEGATGGDRAYSQGPKPFDYAAFKSAYRQAGGKAAWMVNNGYTRDLAIDAVESDRADLVAFGKLYIANPDLAERLEQNALLNTPDQQTFYGGGAKGYIDYPSLGESDAA
ncbi:alkene reductase [Rhizobium sp. PAMB 3174]